MKQTKLTSKALTTAIVAGLFSGASALAEEQAQPAPAENQDSHAAGKKDGCGSKDKKAKKDKDAKAKKKGDKHACGSKDGCNSKDGCGSKQ